MTVVRSFQWGFQSRSSNLNLDCIKPYSNLTGFDFGRAGEHCDSVSAKFYTMHWPLMVEFWSSWIAAARPEVDRFPARIHHEQQRFPATVISPDPESDYWFWDFLVAGSAEARRREAASYRHWSA